MKNNASDKAPCALIIGCNEFVIRRLSRCAEKNGYAILRASGTAQGFSLLDHEHIDLVFTDLDPEDTDGFELCRQVRARTDLPLIVVTQKDDIVDKVLSLELGADDFVGFPFDERELAARMKAVRRRYRPAINDTRQEIRQPEAGFRQEPPMSAEKSRPRTSSEGGDDKTVSFPGLTVSLANYTVTLSGKPLAMPPRELELLFFLASAPNQVFTREQLLDQVWGYDYVGDTRTVDVHIKRLRSKLKGFTGGTIVTVWRVGYKFEKAVSQSQ